MKQFIAHFFCIIHVLAFAICTYIAALEIESILITGWICSATGIAAGVAALVARNRAIAVACFLTPVLAITLTILEIAVLELGPGRAALPFSIIFVITQLITNLIVFHSLSRVQRESSTEPLQISIKTMLVLTLAFAICFAIARKLLQFKHDTMMVIALALAGLTFIGVVLTVYNWFSSWRTKSL